MNNNFNTSDLNISLKQSILEKYNKLIFIVLLVLSFTQLSLFVYSISQNVANWAIVFSSDNDAAHGIRFSEISSWTRDNGYYNYGNLYFRIAYSLQKLDSSIYINKSTVFSELSDQSHHFILMIISLLSMYGITILMSLLITRSKNSFLICNIILNYIFMSNVYWVSKIFGVHPDLLLCLFISLSIYYTAKYFSSENNNTLILSGILWGLCLSVKLSALFYIPSLLLLFIPPNKKNIIKLFKFFSTILITFFVIGFPQNFKFAKIYEFVKYQSSFSVNPTVSSFNEWWVLLYNQYILFIPFIIIFIIFLAENNEIKLSKSGIIRLFLISFIPFIFLLQRNITSPHDHYTLPVVSSLLIFTCISLLNLKSYFIEKRDFTLDNNKNLILTLLFLFTLFSAKIIPNVSHSYLSEKLKCRNDAEDIYNLVKSYQTAQLKTHVDPYVPFSQTLGSVRNNWFKTIDNISPGNADVLVFSKNYYKRFLVDNPDHYTNQDTKKFEEVKKFYSLFSEKTRVKDIYNQEWEKVLDNKCGWEIWKKKNITTSQ